MYMFEVCQVKMSRVASLRIFSYILRHLLYRLYWSSYISNIQRTQTYSAVVTSKLVMFPDPLADQSHYTTLLMLFAI